ncbi:alanine dehydrogenase [Propionicicella superfundia]|uniref:alanine dehydrogenase n=1 Tax=Propionicicella superfundia TaxID=348582 RepID=UPI000410C84D|nr:alanine dehydrogenase [Propionicicella superfundia]
MRIGVPKEIKAQENRVGITPAGVHQLVQHGHTVMVETGAGVGSGISDDDFSRAGATLVSAADAWGEAELVIKVKEPIESEYPNLREDLVLFTYLHLAADQAQTDALLSSGTTAIAYETVQTANGALPLLSPMSEVAGRLSILAGCNSLMRHCGGDGVLLSGVPGTKNAKVVVIGAGVAGSNAAQMAFGLRADVTVIDINLARLAQLDSEFDGHVKTMYSTAYSIGEAVVDADLVIGSVLIPGARAPKLVTNAMIAAAKPGSVFVDIAVDQGGCFEDTHPTTHADPVYKVHDATVYAVANMPGAVPVTSTYALTNATLAYATQLADLGWREALTANPALAKGLNTFAGSLVNAPVAEAWNYEAIALAEVLG